MIQLGKSDAGSCKGYCPVVGDPKRRDDRPNPDMDGNGQLNVNDFMAFLNAYAAQDKRADFNQDGKLDGKDFLAYRWSFEHYDKRNPAVKIEPKLDLTDADSVEKSDSDKT